MARNARANGNWQGMNWIRKDKRLAIYLRDGCACIYCGRGAEDSIILTLDHVKPHTQRGANSERNLVTCCMDCNRSRGAKELGSWLAETREELAVEAILAAVRSHTRRALPREQAKAILAARDTVCFADAVAVASK